MLYGFLVFDLFSVLMFPSSLLPSGHAAVNMRMKARYRVGGYIDEMMSGISQLEVIKDLLTQAEEDWPTLLARLENMRSVILNSQTCRDGMFVDLTGDEAVLETIQPSVDAFLKDLPGDSDGEKLQNFYTEEHPWVAPIKEKMATDVPLVDEGFVLPTQVSYVGKSGIVFDEGDTIDGAAQVVARFLRTGVSSWLVLQIDRNRFSHHLFLPRFQYLWDRVRVM